VVVVFDYEVVMLLSLNVIVVGYDDNVLIVVDNDVAWIPCYDTHTLLNQQRKRTSRQHLHCDLSNPNSLNITILPLNPPASRSS